VKRKLLEEVGQDFETTRQRIREIEARALRSLRRPKNDEPLLDESLSKKLGQVLRTLTPREERILQRRFVAPIVRHQNEDVVVVQLQGPIGAAVKELAEAHAIRAFPIHPLDPALSGLLVLAKKRWPASRAKQFCESTPATAVVDVDGVAKRRSGSLATIVALTARSARAVAITMVRVGGVAIRQER